MCLNTYHYHALPLADMSHSMLSQMTSFHVNCLSIAGSGPQVECTTCDQPVRVWAFVHKWRWSACGRKDRPFRIDTASRDQSVRRESWTNIQFGQWPGRGPACQTIQRQEETQYVWRHLQEKEGQGRQTVNQLAAVVTVELMHC